MKIHNIRLDFATNSSSSHSFLEIPASVFVETDTENDFHWNFFTASNKESKTNYLAYCLHANLNELNISQKNQKKIMSDIFGADFSLSNDVSIDHQSVLTFPRNTDRKTINTDFISDLSQYINEKNIIILGGNDNSESTHPHKNIKDSKNSSINELPKEYSNKGLVATKNGDFWTIFNYENGSKIRLSFVDNPIKEKNIPELADIKITNYCPYACQFCYQDSTNLGQHASLEDITTIAKRLQKENIFEVALGGGEPTMHPQFVEILKIFSEHNIVPNFTTKNLTLLNQKNASEIIKYCGGIAFSVQSVEDMMKVKHSYIESKNQDKLVTSSYNFSSEKTGKFSWEPTINYQLVMGTVDEKTFEKIIKTSENFGHRIILLGYKQNGRGSQFSPHDYSNWLNTVINIKEQNRSLPTISFDTAIATEFKQELINRKIPEETFHTKEGVFSVYIDATTMKFYPSSYTGLEKEKPFTDNWLDDFQKMETEPTPINNKIIKLK